MLESHLVTVVKIYNIFNLKSFYFQIDGSNLALNYCSLAMLSSLIKVMNVGLL